MNYYFKVKYGFGASDFVSVENEDVEKAIYAQIKKIPVKLGNSYINGSNIISITPHYHRYTGWFDSYEPHTGEDWKQIERDCPVGFDKVLSFYQDNVRSCISSNDVARIGSKKEIPQMLVSSRGDTSSIGNILKLKNE